MGNYCAKYSLRKKAFDSLNYLELTRNKIYDAKVVSVYDGDTCHIVIKHNGNFYKVCVRINGIDAPEMRPFNVSNMDIKNEIKQQAKRSRNFLINNITDQKIELDRDISKHELQQLVDNNKKIIQFKYIKPEKYGRSLGDLLINDKSISEIMILNNFAKIYDGGKKN